jgi:BirA family biotin operon repressor/biotin-[acetyl-CoA-carboxylase] ligase
MSKPFDVARARELVARRGLGLGEPLYFAAVTASTNDDALAAARNGAPHGATFVADLQTAGRGRRGARWTAVDRDDLTFSVLLHLALDPSSGAALTLAVGLAVRDACARRVAPAATVKWPNDVWVNDEKLAGILVESTLAAGRPSAVVVGIGINVLTRTFPNDLAHPATSLALLHAGDLGRAELLVDVLDELERRVTAFEREGGLGPTRDEFVRHDALVGRLVQIDDGRRGIAEGIDVNGALLLRTDDDDVERVTAGTVTLVRQ